MSLLNLSTILLAVFLQMWRNFKVHINCWVGGGGGGGGGGGWENSNQAWRIPYWAHPPTLSSRWFLQKSQNVLDVAKIRTLYEEKDSIFPADALAPHSAMPPSAMILTMQDKHVIVYLKEGFPLPVLSQCWEMIMNCNYIFMFSTNKFDMTRVKMISYQYLNDQPSWMDKANK